MNEAIITPNVEHELVARHCLLECRGRQSHLQGDDMLVLLRQAAIATGATILYDYIHPFDGGGVTAAIILAESHITVHTWPEIDFAAFDIFVCGDCDPILGAKVIKDYDNQGEYRQRAFLRGFVK